MTNEEILAFTDRLSPDLPPGFGFLCAEMDDDVRAIIVQEAPGLVGGKIIFIAKDLSTGEKLRSALLILPNESMQELEERAFGILSVLAAAEKRYAAKWN